MVASQTPTRVATLTPFPTATEAPTPTPVNYIEGLDHVPMPESALIEEVVSPDYLRVMGLTRSQVNLTYVERKDSKGVPFVIMLDRTSGVPLALAMKTGSSDLSWKWEYASLSKLARRKGLDMNARAYLVTEYDRKISMDVATTFQMDMVGANLPMFNQTFDWSKVTANWDEVRAQLLQGKIPFENEVFDSKTVAMVENEARFTRLEGLGYDGDVLFYPTMLDDPAIKALSPKDQKTVLFFMAAAKLLKFPEFKKIDLESEVIGYNQREPYATMYKQLGGNDFLVELAFFAKQVKPEIILIVTEDLMYCNFPRVRGYLYPYYIDAYDNFFKLLKELKDKQAPLDEVKLENNMWTLSMPDRELLRTTLRRIKDLGYQIAAPDALVSAADTWLFWSDAPVTTPLKPGETHDQRRAEIYTMLLEVYLQEGSTNFGFHSTTDIAMPAGQQNNDIFDINELPKRDYYLLMKTIFDSLPD